MHEMRAIKQCFEATRQNARFHFKLQHYLVLILCFKFNFTPFLEVELTRKIQFNAFSMAFCQLPWFLIMISF